MTALRNAVAYCTTLACPWTHQEVAQLAGCDPLAARSYLARLAAGGVVVIVPEGYRAGPGAQEWRRKEPKTRPGGHARAYQAARALRAELAQRDWQAKRAGGGGEVLTEQERAGDSMHEQEVAGVAEVTKNVTAGGQAPLVSAEEAAKTLGVSVWTVRRMVARRELVGIRVGLRSLRIAPHSLVAAMENAVIRAGG